MLDYSERYIENRLNYTNTMKNELTYYFVWCKNIWILLNFTSFVNSSNISTKWPISSHFLFLSLYPLSIALYLLSVLFFSLSTNLSTDGISNLSARWHGISLFQVDDFICHFSSFMFNLAGVPLPMLSNTSNVLSSFNINIVF